MMRIIAICSIAVILLQAVIARADEQIERDDSDPDTVDLLVSTIDGPQHGFINGSGFELFTETNLWEIRHNYTAAKRDEPALMAAMTDPQRSVERQLCVASFLLDLNNREAQAFVVKCLDGKLGDTARQNAAFVLVQEDESKELTWRQQEIVKRIEVGDRGRGFDRSWGLFCSRAGDLKLQQAVDPLIGILRRRPDDREAAFALGGIGDRRATAILLETVESGDAIRDGQMWALFLLRAPELPKILLRHLDNHDGIKMLADLGAKEAIGPLEKLMATTNDAEVKGNVRLALARLSATDQKDLAQRLLQIVHTAASDSERTSAIEHIGPTGQRWAVPELLKIAQTGGSWSLVFSTINALGQLGGDQAVAGLVALFDHDFSAQLPRQEQDRMGSDEPLFHRSIGWALKSATGKEFGTDVKAWRKYVNK